MTAELVIIGGGPAGLAAAIAAKKRIMPREVRAEEIQAYLVN